MNKIYTKDYFQGRCGGHEFYQKYGSKVLKPALQAAVKASEVLPHENILDVGCGRGELVSHLADRGFHIEGIDFSEDAIQIAKELNPNATYQAIRLEDAKFVSNSFDCIFFLSTIEHISDEEIQSMLKEMSRILKKGGRLVVSTCTNRLYFKTMTYPFRKKVSQGLGMKEPIAARTDDDKAMHINEQHYYSLQKHFGQFPLRVKVHPQLNPKLTTDSLYGPILPDDFPVRNAPAWKQSLYRQLIFKFPVSLFLARNYLVVAEKV